MERISEEVELEKGDALARIAVGTIGQHARRCIRLNRQRFAQVEARLVGAVVLDGRCAVHVVDVADLVDEDVVVFGVDGGHDAHVGWRAGGGGGAGGQR